MRITVWVVTRDRHTWVTAAEVLVLGVVMLTGGSSLRMLVGLPLLGHLGYGSLTSLPMGHVPGRPERGQQRRRYDLRARIVRFLDEVRRVEDYAQQAAVAGLSKKVVAENLHAAQRRMMAAAAEVAKATGRSPVSAEMAMQVQDAPTEPGSLFGNLLNLRPASRHGAQPRPN